MSGRAETIGAADICAPAALAKQKSEVATMLAMKVRIGKYLSAPRVFARHSLRYPDKPVGARRM